MFAVAEFFDSNINELHNYINQTWGQISLFDFPLQRKLVEASRAGRNYNLSSLNIGTLTKERPDHSVSFVHSHDGQPPIHDGGHRGEYVGDWFISQSYAMILLRDEGYPMVADVDMFNHTDMIRRFMLVRKDCTYGERYDRFDHNNTAGWAFSGGRGFDNSMAVVMTNGEHGTKWLCTKRPHVQYCDFTEALLHTVTTNEHGWAEFECPAGKTSVWVEESKYHQLKAQLDSLDA